MAGELGDQRPHVELTIHWSPCNAHRVLALVHTGANSTLLYGNPDRFGGPLVYIEGYGGCHIRVWQATVVLGTGHLAPRAYVVYISLVAEYILEVGVLQGFAVQTTQGKFHLQV